ncbi:MAG: hypothetical protein COU69_00800 [Candidatus Pacebacteria bacterium CG10_big_fil_rev_8_21_14_0_10_56_10]|nr:MAG: hypothetical protein COU69_00800 [Candidatus Pacebacteria bacterium CG10_big_fil_rev_8_21_14_0_10_56_10]
MRKIGAHLSAAGGADKAVERAAAIGANCLQLFSGSPRVWARRELETVAFDKVAAKQQELSVAPIFTHAIYLTNLASHKSDLVDKSLRVLKYDLEFNSRLGGSGVVVHLGSHQGRGWPAIRRQVAEVLGRLLADAPRNSTLLIENSAGQQGKVGSDLAEVKWLLDTVGSRRLGWCVDTCHAWAAGYYLGKSAPVSDVEFKSLIDEINRLELWIDLKCVHVNDSRDPFNSGRDRHANLGEGLVPRADLRYFLNQRHLRHLPLILEVPGFDGDGPDARNVELLRRLLR